MTRVIKNYRLRLGPEQLAALRLFEDEKVALWLPVSGRPSEFSATPEYGTNGGTAVGALAANATAVEADCVCAAPRAARRAGYMHTNQLSFSWLISLAAEMC